MSNTQLYKSKTLATAFCNVTSTPDTSPSPAQTKAGFCAVMRNSPWNLAMRCAASRVKK